MDKTAMLLRIIDKYSGGNKAQFAELLGVKPQTISSWVTRGSFDTELVYSKCIGLNSGWLLTGNGEMSETDKSGCLEEGIPLIPISAMAGAFKGEHQVLECECEKYVVPAFRGADFLIHVKGDSMEPTYRSGDIVACKRVPMDGLFFQWNHVYVLDTDQGALIKRVCKSENESALTLKSDNSLYDPFDVPTDRIYNVALVLGLIRLE